jgi:hypothetical protein
MDISRYDYEDIPVDPAIMTDMYSSAAPGTGTSNNGFGTEATEQEVQGHGGMYGAQIYGDDADAQLQAELASEMITRAAGGE